MRARDVLDAGPEHAEANEDVKMDWIITEKDVIKTS